MKRLFLMAMLLMIAAGGVQAQYNADWNPRVFYEIFVRSFYDSNGDGIGDLQGVIEKLDYLNDGDPATTDDLGVTGIWLMPVTDGLSYHGYDVVDYRQIDPDYGTNADFLELIDAAHQRGIAVIMDLVINHTSVQHPWFISSATEPDSPYADYYIWADEDPNYSGPAHQQVWHPLGERFYYGLFWDGMPDLNYENPAVTQEMYDIARFWLEDMGVDGFRLDAVKHIIEEDQNQENTAATIAWMQDFNAFVHSVKPEALTVGEIYSGSFAVAPYVPDAVDVAFEFDLASNIIDSVRRRSSQGVASIQNRALELYPQYAAFLTNHDQNRVMSAFQGDVRQAKLAASLLLTGPGLPFIYYGEEIGMEGEKPDEFIRTPMQWSNDAENAGFSNDVPWEAPDESVAEINVAAQTDDADSLLNHYRQLIHLRNQHPALQTGAFQIVETPRQLYSFLRVTDDETLLVLLNLHSADIEDYALALPADVVNMDAQPEMLLGTGDLAALDATTEDGLITYQPLAVLPARSTWIIKLK